MRGIGPSRGSRASAAGPLRGASVGAAALLLLLGGWFVAPAPATGQASTDDEPTTTTDPAATADEAPSCPTTVAGLELATNLDFADVARALAAEGAIANPTGEITTYELYCPYGELPASAASNSTAPLSLRLSWGVVAAEDGPGCFDDDGEDPDATSGVVGDPDRRAQVDWSVETDAATSSDAIAAAEELLAATPGDAVDCPAASTDGEEAASSPAGDSTTQTPLLVIAAAAVIALVAGLVLLVRRRSRSHGAEASPPEAGAGPAVGPSPVPGPLIAGAAAPQRAVRSLPDEVLGSMAAAGEPTPRRAAAVVDAARRAAPATVGPQAAAFGLVAATAGTLAAASDTTRRTDWSDEQRHALAAAMRTLAQGAARSARRASEARVGAPSADLDELVRAAQRLVDAHRDLLQPPARTETPR